MTHFRIKGRTKLKKMMDISCERLGVSRFDVAFLHAGSRINDEDTVESLAIQEGDVIEVFPRYNGMNSLKKLNDSDNSKSKHIKIIKVTMAGRDEIHFRIKSKTKLKKLVYEFSDQLGVPSTELVFLYAGSKIKDDDTIESLNIKEGDVIEAFPISKCINLHITNKDGVIVRYGTKKKTKLKKLMDMHCKRYQIPRSLAYFVYHGFRVLDEDTADSLNMQELDNIEFYSPQPLTSV